MVNPLAVSSAPNYGWRKLADRSLGRPEGSLFNTYYT